MKTSINAGTLKGLLRIVPRDLAAAHCRPQIFGVTFEPDGIVMATNGSSLIALRTGREFAGPGFVVQADTLRAAIKGQKPRFAIEIERPEEPIEPLAPANWRRVIPESYSGERGGNALNPELVLDVLAAINDIQETEGLASASRPVKVLSELPNGPSAWLLYATDRILAICMPMRGTDMDARMVSCAADFLKGARS